MATAVSHNFSMTLGSNQSNDLILSLGNNNQPDSNHSDSLSSTTDSEKPLESLSYGLIDIENIADIKEHINTIINFVHAVKCTIIEENQSENVHNVKQKCLKHDCVLFKDIYLHFKMCYYEKKCDNREVCPINGYKEVLFHWLIRCTNKKCRLCKILNRHKRKPGNYDALAKLERILKGEEDITNEKICKDRAQLSHLKSLKALKFIMEQIRKGEVEKADQVSLLVEGFLYDLVKPVEFIESVNTLVPNIPTMCPCCLSFLQQNTCTDTPNGQEIAKDLPRNNKNTGKQRSDKSSTAGVCNTSVVSENEAAILANISNETLNSTEKCFKILEQKSSKLTSSLLTTTSTQTSLTTTSKTNVTTTKVETDKTVKTSQEIKMDIKEKEENMPELTGSITLCPSRKGFRSMRKGRSGKGNSGSLTVTLQIRANDEHSKSRENSNQTTDDVRLALESLRNLEQLQELVNEKRAKESSNEKSKNSSSSNLKESPDKKIENSSNDNTKESSDEKPEKSSIEKLREFTDKNHTDDKLEVSSNEKLKEPINGTDEMFYKEKLTETSIKKPIDFFKEKESSIEKLKESSREEIEKLLNEKPEKSTNEFCNEVAANENPSKKTSERVIEKEERTIENYQKLSELQSFQPLTRPVNPPLGLLKDENIWQTNDQIRERMESGTKLEIKPIDEPVMRKMLTRERGSKKKNRKESKIEDSKIVAEKMVGDKKLEIELTGQRIKYLTGVFRQSLIGILHAIKCKVPNYSRESATNQSADSVTSDNEPKKKNSKTTCDMPMCHKYKDFYFRHMPICLEKRSCKEPNCNVENVRLGFQHWLITCGNVKRCEMCKPLERIKRKRSNRETFEEIKKYLRLNEIIDAGWDSSDNAETVGTIEVNVKCQGEAQWTEAQKEKLKEADSSCSKKVRKVIMSKTLAAAATKQDAHSPGELCRPYKEIHIDSVIESEKDKSIKIVLVTSDEASLRCYNYIMVLMETARKESTGKEFINILKCFKEFIEVYCDTDTFVKNYTCNTGKNLQVNFITNLKTLRKDMIVDRHKELRKYHEINVELCKHQDSNLNFTQVDWPGFTSLKGVSDDDPDRLLNHAFVWLNLNEDIVKEMMLSQNEVVYMTPIYAKFLNLI